MWAEIKTTGFSFDIAKNCVRVGHVCQWRVENATHDAPRHCCVINGQPFFFFFAEGC